MRPSHDHLAYVAKGLLQFTLLGCLTLAGCASLTPEQCKVADWKAIGEKEGFEGQPERLAQHLKSCAPVGVTPNTALYRQGYKTGLKLYCQPQSILNHAIEGDGRIDTCPIQQQGALANYYRVGHELYSARSTLDQLNRDQKQLEKELAEPKTSESRRGDIRRKLRELDIDLSEARRTLQRKEYAFNQLQPH